MTDGILLRAIRHNTWANLELLAFCAKLTPDQLAWTAQGTFGTLHHTLQHTVSAEQSYLLALTGERPPIEVAERSKPLTADWTAPIAELLERARSSGERLERAIASGIDPARMITRPSRATAAAAIIAAQYLHHGSDHRAHVGTILGANAVEGPDLDVWTYGRTIGEVIPPP